MQTTKSQPVRYSKIETGLRRVMARHSAWLSQIRVKTSHIEMAHQLYLCQKNARQIIPIKWGNYSELCRGGSTGAQPLSSNLAASDCLAPTVIWSRNATFSLQHENLTISFCTGKRNKTTICSSNRIKKNMGAFSGN